VVRYCSSQPWQVRRGHQRIRTDDLLVRRRTCRAVVLTPDMGPDDMHQKLLDAIATFNDQEHVLFLVDLWGGTPFNQVSRIIERKSTRIGLPLPDSTFPCSVSAYGSRMGARHAIDVMKEIFPRPRAASRSSPRRSSLPAAQPSRHPQPSQQRPLPFPQAPFSVTATSSTPTFVSIPASSTPGCHGVDQAGLSRPHPSWSPTASRTTTSART